MRTRLARSSGSPLARRSGFVGSSISSASSSSPCTLWSFARGVPGLRHGAGGHLCSCDLLGPHRHRLSSLVMDVAPGFLAAMGLRVLVMVEANCAPASLRSSSWLSWWGSRDVGLHVRMRTGMLGHVVSFGFPSLLLITCTPRKRMCMKSKPPKELGLELSNKPVTHHHQVRSESVGV